jgi:hypothetical protein
MGKKLIRIGLWALALAAFVKANEIAQSAMSVASGYSSGGTFYTTFEQCLASSSEACMPQMGGFSSFLLNTSALSSSILLVAIGLFLAIPNPVISKSIERLSEVNQRRAAAKEQALVRQQEFELKERARLVAEAKVSGLSPSTESIHESNPNATTHVPNYSLSNMRVATSLLIGFAILCALVSAALYNASSQHSYFLENGQEARDLATAAAWMQIAETLFAIGILGKLLIGASKIIVEGLGGNVGNNK